MGGWKRWMVVFVSMGMAWVVWMEWVRAFCRGYTPAGRIVLIEAQHKNHDPSQRPEADHPFPIAPSPHAPSPLPLLTRSAEAANETNETNAARQERLTAGQGTGPRRRNGALTERSDDDDASTRHFMTGRWWQVPFAYAYQYAYQQRCRKRRSDLSPLPLCLRVMSA